VCVCVLCDCRQENWFMFIWISFRKTRLTQIVVFLYFVCRKTNHPLSLSLSLSNRLLKYLYHIIYMCNDIYIIIIIINNDNDNKLRLVASRRSLTTRLFKLSPFVLHVRFGVRVRHTGGTKVLHGFSRVLRASQENDAFTSRCLQRQLIKSQAFAASFGDSRASRRGESQCANRQLWHFVHSHIISNRTNNARNFTLFTFHEFRKLG